MLKGKTITAKNTKTPKKNEKMSLKRRDTLPRCFAIKKIRINFWGALGPIFSGAHGAPKEIGFLLSFVFF